MIFTYSEENVAFLKNPTMEACKARIGDAPYWTVHGRICYHDHPVPTYIIHHDIPIEAEVEWFEHYVHVYPDKKTLYAMSHYSLTELKELAKKLAISDEGKKKELYERIQNEFKPFLSKMVNAV
jgi:hypothetical protein